MSTLVKEELGPEAEEVSKGWAELRGTVSGTGCSAAFTTEGSICLMRLSISSLVPSLFSLARGGKESGEVPIQFLFRAPGSWRSNQIAERELRHHFRERNHIILRAFETAP